MGPVYDTASLRIYARLPEDHWARDCRHLHTAPPHSGGRVIVAIVLAICALGLLAARSVPDAPAPMELAQTGDSAYSSRP